MKRIYVAGPYSADNVLDVLRNIGRGQKMCAKLFYLGFSPFCPWHDKTYTIDNPEANTISDEFYNHSMAWLKVSEGVLVLPNYQKSKGTLAEIKQAKELNIPVFYSVEGLLTFFIFNGEDNI